jgi:hypothetical protein
MSKQVNNRSSSKTDNKKEILDGETFVPSTDITYSKPKLNQSGGKSIGILNTNTNGSTYISAPLMLTWGIQEFVDKKTGDKSYSMSLQFPGEEYKNAATDRFFDNMKKFEAKIKADALTNQKDWFGKSTMTAEAINILWSPMLHYAKNPQTGEPDLSKNPTLRLKVPIWEGEWKVELYDVNGDSLFPNQNGTLPTEIVPKGTNVAVIMQCGGIWFAGGAFGVTWKLFQAVVKPKPTLKGKCHIKLNADDIQKVASQEIHADSDGCDAAIAQDTDDEDDVPAPVVLKTPAPVVAAPVVETQHVNEPAPIKKTIVKRVVKKD